VFRIKRTYKFVGKIDQRSTPYGYLKPSENRAWVGFNETTDSFLGNYLTFKKVSDQILGSLPQQFHLQDRVKGGVGLSFLLINQRNKKFILFTKR
jgi:hypothetical protein